MAVVRFTIGLIFLFATRSSFPAPPEKPLAVVADPRYGAALYEFYQGDYRSALLELMIAEKRGGIEGHGDRPLIMKGSFSLAYGMEERASEIFHQVLDSDSPPDIRDVAWFHLAKIRYLRGDWPAVEQTLAKIGASPPQDIAGDLASLRVNLAIQQDNLKLAASLLLQAPPESLWLPYGYYNLGAAESRAGEFATAVDYYIRAAAAPQTTTEYVALFDRAMTSAGYSYLLKGDYAQAQAKLSRVHLTSPLSNRAMLGYGWAAARQKEFVEALSPWQHLADQSLSDEYVQEALVAIPFAYEQLGNKGLALEHFKQAEQRFGGEILRIEKFIDELDAEGILDVMGLPSIALPSIIPPSTTEFDRFSYMASDAMVANGTAPRLAYLATLFARNDFQLQLQNLRDLMAMQKNLQRWHNKLELYSDMLDEREKARRLRVNYLTQLDLDRELSQMQTRRDHLAQRIERIAQQKDYLALASGAEAALLERLTNVEKSIATLADAGQQPDDLREDRRLYTGLLLWQASEEFDDRLRSLREHLVDLDEQLLELDTSRERVEEALASSGNLNVFRTRIAAAKLRLEQQLPALDTAMQREREEVRGQILQVLQQQQQRLNYYLAQSRLAVARLYDSARMENRDAAQ
jgi:hypothetical protein